VIALDGRFADVEDVQVAEEANTTGQALVGFGKLLRILRLANFGVPAR
jgi:hypothetical protein